ncbi:endonuclease/exonuclease/phosphatase family protein [Puniceibacterium sp. IMCC21224]|uniref:endonuclease/exonuclease/phosphatase family protein n=1 Tax=Puniceibacterium sp. IMCC21224 TaxID=1618204 RepID=UPI00064D8F67|nr:endonuclease/exonuclease/phosphatase family protein [Puniceibacterium sp. IMCC21224]KMK65615.1 metal-dependent hydrolase [Puniceibacterium sp. IMCC21224]
MAARLLRAMLKVAVLGLLGLSLVACAMILANSGQSQIPPKPPGSLRLASYNVHYILLNQGTGPWSLGDWDRRKAPLDAAVKAVDADVIAFQEMESFSRGDDGGVNLTLDYLLAQNPEYRAAAVGDWRDFPATQPILYRRDSLRLLDQGWFFFSDTPDVIYSRTFNGSYPAFASWAEFQPQDGSKPFRVYNVHFEYKSGSNRRLSAALVRDRIAPVIAGGTPAFLAGDINARHGSATMDLLTEAGLRFAPVDGATYHFNRGINLFGAIDHLGATPDLMPLGPPVVLRQKFLGEWPTDHYPVLADFALPR